METRTKKEFALQDLVTTLRRRRWVVFGVPAVFVLVAILYCLFCTRRYESEGSLQVQKESSDSMGLEGMMSEGGPDTSTSLDINITVQTQANILQSDTLALETITDLDLEHNSDFKVKQGLLSRLLAMLQPQGVPDPANASFANSPQRQRRALQRFSDNLVIKPVVGTRLITIDYTNPDPQVAAAVVNKLMQSLKDYTYQTRYDATNDASHWLNGQLGDLRKQAEDLQKRVADLKRESGIYSFGNKDAQGQEQAYSSILDQLQQTTQALQQAQANRILKGAIAKAAETGNAEMLSSLAGNSSASGPGGITGTLAVIQSLREQEAGQVAAVQQAETRYGPGYPKLGELRAAVAGTERSIRDEVARIRERAESDYAIAQHTEAGIRERYEAGKKQADELNNKAIEYTITSQEADQSRQLYENLLQRLKEAGVLEGLKSTNITVVDPGRPPAKPKHPSVPLIIGFAFGGGLLLGLLGAYLLHALDNKVVSVLDLEHVVREPLLGVTPQFVELSAEVGMEAVPPTLMSVREPHSTYTESMRSIRTSLLLARGDRPPKVILITSSVAGEGKTLFSTNLAALLAMQGQRVLLVEADIRRGALAKRLRLEPGSGLTALLAGQTQTPSIQKVPGVENLDVLLRGIVPPNPSELLGSGAMRRWVEAWIEQYDFIVLDGPPVLPVTDAVLLQALADMTIMLARSSYTERAQAQRSFQALKLNTSHYVGVVLNGINPRDPDYYGYYGYYGYRANAYGDESE